MIYAFGKTENPVITRTDEEGNRYYVGIPIPLTKTLGYSAVIESSQTNQATDGGRVAPLTPADEPYESEEDQPDDPCAAYADDPCAPCSIPGTTCACPDYCGGSTSAFPWKGVLIGAGLLGALALILRKR